MMKITHPQPQPITPLPKPNFFCAQPETLLSANNSKNPARHPGLSFLLFIFHLFDHKIAYQLFHHSLIITIIHQKMLRKYHKSNPHDDMALRVTYFYHRNSIFLLIECKSKLIVYRLIKRDHFNEIILGFWDD